MSTKITYNGKTTELAYGYIATLPCKDLKMETDVVVEAPEGEGGSSGGGAELNIAYGDTAPEDTSKLWVKTTQPSAVKVSSETIHPDETCTLLSATMPITYLKGMGIGERDGKIYLFGGGDYVKSIYCFDTTTETLSTLSATLPVYGGNWISSATVGTKIYLFGLNFLSGQGGDTGIYCFDTDTETISKLNATLPVKTVGMTSATIGTKIYLFGGGTGTGGSIKQAYDTCYCFDTETETLSTLSVTLPEKKVRMASITIGTKVYMLAGAIVSASSGVYPSQTCYCFDAEKETIEQLKNIGSTSKMFTTVASIGETIYIFILSEYRSIGTYNIETQTYTEKNVMIPVEQINVSPTYALLSACAVGNKIYVFGQTQYISVFEAPQDVILATDNLQILPTLSSNKFNLINIDTAQVEIGVSKVYKGNADGIGEEVEAALHNGTSWVTI